MRVIALIKQTKCRTPGLTNKANEKFNSKIKKKKTEKKVSNEQGDNSKQYIQLKNIHVIKPAACYELGASQHGGTVQ